MVTSAKVYRGHKGNGACFVDAAFVLDPAELNVADALFLGGCICVGRVGCFPCPRPRTVVPRVNDMARKRVTPL